MILVTLGTQDKSFIRLLDEINRLIEKKVIKEKVIVQAGYTKYESENMEIFDYIAPEEMNKYVKKCDLLITHAGVGSILSGLNNNKKVIAVPRLCKYKEHTNDHQVEIAREFTKKGYIISVNKITDLEKEIKNIKNFKPNKLQHNNEIVNTIEDFIDYL